ncbi:MAG: hypothetical protein AAGE98_00535 [Actinomycetota bacterium]
MAQPVIGLWRGTWSGVAAGIAAGLKANVFLAVIMFTVTATEGDVGGGVGAVVFVALLGTPVAVLLGAFLGAIAGGLVGLLGWLDGAPVVFALTAAAFPLHVMYETGIDSYEWNVIGLSSLVGFWVIGFRQGLRFADDELEPPIRIEITEPYWVMKPG